jgi:predicted lysophospholipase L1 biosynthesis ABC-type transport system permease subunit
MFRKILFWVLIALATIVLGSLAAALIALVLMTLVLTFDRIFETALDVSEWAMTTYIACWVCTMTGVVLDTRKKFWGKKDADDSE